jgi:hypothetical protein
MPHAVAIDERAASSFRDRQHAPVHVVRHADDHALGRASQAFRPVLAHKVMIGADSTGCHDHGLRPQRELADDIARTLESALDVAGR